MQPISGDLMFFISSQNWSFSHLSLFTWVAELIFFFFDPERTEIFQSFLSVHQLPKLLHPLKFINFVHKKQFPGETIQSQLVITNLTVMMTTIAFCDGTNQKKKKHNFLCFFDASSILKFCLCAAAVRDIYCCILANFI